jgi:excisionase family DNA binding protein
MSEPLTAKQAANELGYHIKYLYHLLKAGKIKGQKFGSVWMIDLSEVDRIKALQGPGGRLPKRLHSTETRSLKE